MSTLTNNSQSKYRTHESSIILSSSHSLCTGSHCSDFKHYKLVLAIFELHIIGIIENVLYSASCIQHNVHPGCCLYQEFVLYLLLSKYPPIYEHLIVSSFSLYEIRIRYSQIYHFGISIFFLAGGKSESTAI